MIINGYFYLNPLKSQTIHVSTQNIELNTQNVIVQKFKKA